MLKKYFPFILLILLITIKTHSQHTKKFLELSKGLKFIDSTKTIKKYKNGNLKVVFTKCKYLYGDYEYEYFCSKNLLYRKDGSLLVGRVYDGFGNILSYKLINKKMQTNIFIKTISIDNVSINIDAFLRKNKNFKIKVLEKNYSNCKNDSLFLYEEGFRLNRKKIGVWKTYNCCDSTFKEKNHSK